MLSLEPFLSRICLNPDIQGLSVGGNQYKISAYADDLFFSLINPAVSLPNLLREFEIYGSLSNMKINWHKSEEMGIGIPSTLLLIFRSSFNFKWTATALKYLGTYIPTTISRVFEFNFPPLLSRIRILLDTWNKGLHSWFGRFNLLKGLYYLSFFIYFKPYRLRFLLLTLDRLIHFLLSLSGHIRNRAFLSIYCHYLNNMAD